MVRNGIVACFFAILSTACFVDYSNHHPPVPLGRPGDVTFTWSFEGRSCFSSPEVFSVLVSVPGVSLPNQGSYYCRDEWGRDGVILRRLPPGSYPFTIEAFDQYQQILYVTSGTLLIDGSTWRTVDLTRPNQPPAMAYVSWYFPPLESNNSPNCRAAGIRFVDMSIDGAPYVRFPCESGQNAGGVATPYLTDGAHSIELVALTQEEYPLYRTRSTLSTFAGSPISADFLLNWSVGGVAISWSLLDGQGRLTCQQAGVTSMRIDFLDALGNWVYGSQGDVQSCDAAPIVYNYLQPGSYQVFVSGLAGNGAILYSSDRQQAPWVNVQAGRFVSGNLALNVPLSRL